MKQRIHVEETATACTGCGAELWPRADHAFACSGDSYLCVECAERLGGIYDPEEGWAIAPDLSALESGDHPRA